VAVTRLAPGTVLSGRYQLAEVIGESDLSTVYAALDQRGQAQVAVKVFGPSVMSRVAALSEYQSQARQASGLGVEGIARAYDFGIDANAGAPFSTAERVSWVSLDRRVLAHGPLGVVELSRALGVLARALDAAHAAGLCHRDLKPQNIFISPDNPEWVRITDFGVSAVRRGAPEALGWGGPPGYTPPDAVDAAAPGSPGVDLFAVGVIAFFALTRATPFRSLRSPTFDPNAHWSELNQPLTPIGDRAKEVGVALDPALDAWFARALALAPQDRFRSAGEMARELSVMAEHANARGGGGPRTMPGIAAAIAQPLVFQPEPSPASLGLAPPAKASPAPMTAAPAGGTRAPVPATVASPAEEPIHGVPKKGSAVPLLIGLGLLLFGGLAFASYKLSGESGGAPSAVAAASAAPTASAASSTVAPAAAAPARARFTCQPEACESVVCDGKNVAIVNEDIELPPGPHDCIASKNGFGSKSMTFTVIPGKTEAVVFELPALPVSTPQKAALANPSTTTEKPTSAAPAATPKPAVSPKAVAPAAAKPAATTAAAKPTTIKPKKKCSTFLGCK
jgi:eukaryotic-like serine/threonine-protein kinase